MSNSTPLNHRRHWWRHVHTAAAACGLAGTLTLCGCVAANPTADPPGPPAAWVQLNKPVSAAPVEYERRVAPPQMALQTPPPAPPMELTPSQIIGPAMPAPAEAPEPPLPTPPLAPAAELSPFPEAATTVPPSADAFAAPYRPAQPAVEQSMLDDLSAQLAALDQRMNAQTAAMEQAQQEASAAREATMRLQTEFINWQAELDVVRDTIHAQSAADVEALGELNQALDVLINQPPQRPSPGDEDMPHTVRGGRTNRGTR